MNKIKAILFNGFITVTLSVMAGTPPIQTKPVDPIKLDDPFGPIPPIVPTEPIHPTDSFMIEPIPPIDSVLPEDHFPSIQLLEDEKWNKELTFYPSMLPNSKENYVMSMSILDKDASDAVTTIVCYDGLGRPSQTLTGGVNPNGKFLHSLNVYDAMGNVIQTWNPVVGDTKPTVLSESAFKKKSASEYDGDQYGYTATSYDILGRTTSATQPGEAWRNHKQSTLYSSNEDEIVKKYVLENGKPVMSGYYSKGSLSCVKAEDEDGHTVEKYTDGMGNVVLERRGTDICTYYVYNKGGQLRFVLSPMYQENPDLNLFAYQYTYDGYGRVKTKKLPGCESVEYWYDGADRVVKMQDGLLRQKGKYRTYSYDAYGRLLQQKVLDNNGKETCEIANYYDSYKYENKECKKNLSYCMTFNGIVVCSVIDYFRKNFFSPKGLLAETVQTASNGEELLSIYGYDEKTRLSMKADFGLGGNLIITFYKYNYFDAVEKETVCEFSAIDKTYHTTYIQSYSESRKEWYYSGEIDTMVVNKPSYQMIREVITDNKYEHPHNKQLTSSVITIKDLVNNVAMTDTIQKPTYDEYGRVILNDRSGGAADVAYEYDKLHGWVTSIKGAMEDPDYGYSMIQNLYRETGSAEPCWNGSISAMEWSTTPLYLYRYDYYYDEYNRLKGSVYSVVKQRGSISSSVNTNQEETQKMSNTLIEKSTGTLIPESDKGEILEYDANSNIKSIKRYGYNPQGQKKQAGALIDDLEITYYGNQKKRIDDFAEPLYYNNAFDFKDDADKDVEYTYDENGNLTYDANKDLHFEYDLLRHLVSVDGSKCSIEYVYSADGRKLRTIHKQYKDGAKKNLLTSTQKDYQGNLIYKNELPEMYQFDGGYYEFEKGILKNCYFYIKDYQGNNRMLTDNTDMCSQRMSYYPYGITSSALERQDFKYSGKELDRTYGLDLYDFHARQYDPVLGCFNSIDPLAEKYYNISPYAYCAGDPVNCIDPTGCSTRVVKNDSTGHYDVIGGNLEDGDKRIYLYTNEKDGVKPTEKVLGYTPTITSFYNHDTNKFEGTINPNDNSGIIFLAHVQKKETCESWLYWYHALSGNKYDFKILDYEKAKANAEAQNRTLSGTEYSYRGMPIGDGIGGLKVYTSAREIGNMTAGYAARMQGMSWSFLRLCFDAYESVENFTFQKEGLASQNAQKLGYHGLLRLK